MSILRHLVGITCEMLTLRDPYDQAAHDEARERGQERRARSPRIVTNDMDDDRAVLVKWGDSPSWSVMAEEAALQLQNVMDERNK